MAEGDVAPHVFVHPVVFIYLENYLGETYIGRFQRSECVLFMRNGADEEKHVGHSENLKRREKIEEFQMIFGLVLMVVAV